MLISLYAENIFEEHQKQIEVAEDKGQILFAAKGKEKHFEYLFQSPN